jgi:surfactin synthase thioesterase subunit
VSSFGRHTPDYQAKVTLFCLPYSGGGASTYNRWRPMLPDHIDLTPVHLPGREGRLAESDPLSARVIAEALADRIDRPYAIYGHSMGGRLGFEVIRSLRALGIRPPVRFYPAACPPPHVHDPVLDCVDLPDEPFIEVLIERFGALKELRDNLELQELALPVIRRDLEWCRDYRYAPGVPLPTTIVALAGEDDVVTGPEVMAGWSQHGSRFELRTLPGEHMFLNSAAAQLTALLTADLTRALDPMSAV